MTIFNLPDLGEGLPDAEICEWHVKEGDQVEVDQPLVSMETAKAVVEVPSPQTGKIIKLYGKAGDIIQTGAPLAAFANTAKKQDAGTVVGSLAASDETLSADFIIGAAKQDKATTVKATPAVRALARKLNIDLATVRASRKDSVITAEDVNRHHAEQAQPEAEALRGVRRAMAITMTQSHREVVPVTIYDDADINTWQATEDTSIRLIQALVTACGKEPALNVWYDSKANSRRMHKQVNLGLAMDTEEGLFVPVIHDADSKSDTQLRDIINQLKTSVGKREIPPEQLRDPTIILSNFGKFAGRYANPIIVPPTVAILAAGKIRNEAVISNDEIAAHRIMPLSLTFDHRAVTGGEASRFLGIVIAALEK